MFCKSCGQQIDDDSQFCRHCGTQVSEDAQAGSDGDSVLFNWEEDDSIFDLDDWGTSEQLGLQQKDANPRMQETGSESQETPTEPSPPSEVSAVKHQDPVVFGEQGTAPTDVRTMPESQTSVATVQEARGLPDEMRHMENSETDGAIHGTEVESDSDDIEEEPRSHNTIAIVVALLALVFVVGFGIATQKDSIWGNVPPDVPEDVPASAPAEQSVSEQ